MVENVITTKGNSHIRRKSNSGVNFENIIVLQLLPRVVDESLKVWSPKYKVSTRSSLTWTHKLDFTELIGIIIAVIKRDSQ